MKFLYSNLKYWREKRQTRFNLEHSRIATYTRMHSVTIRKGKRSRMHTPIKKKSRFGGTF